MAGNAVLAMVGLVLLTIAADHLVLGSSRLATRLGISPIVVGVIVIGLGTSAPEFVVSGVAAANGDTGIAVGNLIGSNMLNLTLILGIAALAAPIAVRSNVVRREVPLAVAAVALFALACWIGLGVVIGVALLVPLAVALVLLLRWARTAVDPALRTQVAEFTDGAPTHRVGVESTRALLGLAGVIAGAQLLVGNAAGIAERLGVSPLVIGFTLGLRLTRAEACALLLAYGLTLPLLPG